MTAIVQDEDVRAECIKYALQIGCCPKCALRFVGEEAQHVYSLPTKEILSKLKTEENEVSLDQNDDKIVCVACLGILQSKFCGDRYCNELSEIIKKEDNEFTDYYIALSTPVSLLLRDHSIWISLQEKFPDVYLNEAREKVITIKEVWRFYNCDMLSKYLGQAFNSESNYTINLNFRHAATKQECRFLLDLFPDVFKQRKQMKHGCEMFNRTNVSKAVKDLSYNKFKSNYSCPPKVYSYPCVCDSVKGTYESIFIAGRYNKFSRVLSQTEWIIDGERKTESSIEEIIAGPLHTHIKADSMRFSSSGREDVDVKMLGNGRPFLFECINPHRVLFTQEKINEIQAEINKSTKDLSVKYLQLVTKEDTGFLKEGEIDKIKCYSAVCWSRRSLTQADLDNLNDHKDIVLQQKTPIRVLHRRPLAVREKIIHTVKAKRLNEHHFLVRMDTQAGTYIKEFVHGDFGRTTPNLCSLLNTDCDILQLDVQAVLLDWPKEIIEKSAEN